MVVAVKCQHQDESVMVDCRVICHTKYKLKNELAFDFNG